MKNIYLYLTTCMFAASFDVSAAENCALDVRSNQAGLEVSVDGKVIGKTPQVIKCADTERRITLTSSDNQVFTRVMPSRSKFSSKDSSWNVFIIPKSRAMNPSVVMPGTGDGGVNPDILAELREMKQMLSQLLHRYPELAPKLEVKMAKMNRAVSSTPLALAIPNVAVAAPTPAPVEVPSVAVVQPPRTEIASSEEPYVMEGAFVQLHSLRHKEFVKEDVVKEFGPEVKDANVRLSFCKWKSGDNNTAWTRVMMGPYDKESAKKVVQRIGRDARVVTSPRCFSQRIDVSF